MGDPPEARTALVHIEAEPRAWLAKAAAAGTQIYADVGWDPTQQWSRDLLDQLSCVTPFSRTRRRRWRTRAPRARSRPWAR